MPVTHLERRKIEAGVLIPMLQAFQRALGKERANEIAREAIVELAPRPSCRVRATAISLFQARRRIIPAQEEMAALFQTLNMRSAAAPSAAVPVSLEQEELRGISRTVAEIHWLLLVLVFLYELFVGVGDAESSAAVSAGLFFYAALVMGFRYVNFYRRETRWKIAIECWGMIAFVTWVLWFSGRLGSPLLNAFLLPVITSALTLGKATTLINVALIAACYVFLGGAPDARALLSLRFAAGFAAELAPVLLVAYITTMFSADI